MGRARRSLAQRRGGDRPPRREAPDALRVRQPGADPSGTPGREPHQPVPRAPTSSASPSTVGRAPRPAPVPRSSIDQAITALDPAGHLAYRGWDATRAAVDARYEQVAAWLWGTTFGPNDHWTADPAGAATAREVQAALPPATPLPDRLRVAVAALRPGDPLPRRPARPRPWPHAPATLLATLVEALPPVDPRDTPSSTGSLARRLWTRVSPLEPTTRRVRALDRALVAARRPRARDVDARRARRRLGLGRSLPAAAHRARDRRAARCTAGRRSSSARCSATRWPPTPRRPSDSAHARRRARARVRALGLRGSRPAGAGAARRDRGEPAAAATSGAPPQVCST